MARVRDIAEEPDTTLRSAGIVRHRSRVALEHATVAEEQLFMAFFERVVIQIRGTSGELVRVDELVPYRR